MTAPTHTEPAPSQADRWPAWFAVLGFVLALTAAFTLAGIVTVVAFAIDESADSDSPGITIAATLLQDVGFVVSALWLARQVSKPRAADLGLRPAPLRHAVAATLVAAAAFYAFVVAYSALVSPDGEQDVLDSLGADQGAGLLIASGFIVIVVAPFAEEILFRGFMYRCLRNRLSPLVAAGGIGAIFGSIHYSGPDTLELIPVLVVLGAVFCLLYERTGSLYPAIALHAINNALAFAVTADESGAAGVAVVSLIAALGLCFAFPARQARELTPA